MHFFCSLISFSILFRNTVFLVSILEMRHYKLSMNSCIRYFFGLFYSSLSVFSCKVKQQCRLIHSEGWTTMTCLLISEKQWPTLIYSVIFYSPFCYVGKTHRNIVPRCFFCVKLKVFLCSVMNWFKKRWLIVVRLARARNKSIKIKIILNIAFILCYSSSWLNCMCVFSVLNLSDTILPNSWVDT